MDIPLTVFPWCFASIAVFAAGFLLLSVLVGEVAEFAGGLFEGIEGVLEGIGLDISGELGEGEGVGCGVVAAFFAGFGIAGWIASLLGAAWSVSLLVALGGGVVIAAVYFVVLRTIARQQVSMVTHGEDLVGKTVRVTTNIPAGTVGEGMLDVGGTRSRYPIKGLESESFRRGDLARIERVEGGTLFVRKL